MPVHQHQITDLNDPRIAHYRSLKLNVLRDAGIFIAESLPVVKTLLTTKLRVLSCLATPQMSQRLLSEMPTFEQRAIPLYVLTAQQAGELIGFRFHQGIMAAAAIPARAGIREQVGSWQKPHLLVALNGVHDAQNVGLIIRNCAAFNTDTVIVGAKTQEPFYRKVVRVSMGAIFNQRLAYETELAPALHMLKKEYGTRIVVTSHKQPAIPLSQADLSGNICFVFGNEATGIDPDIAGLADLTVTIPIAHDRIESLNVAGAGAVCLYQARSFVAR